MGKIRWEKRLVHGPTTFCLQQETASCQPAKQSTQAGFENNEGKLISIIYCYYYYYYHYHHYYY